MRYVVLVKPPDDHPGFVRIMGTFDKREKAETLCQRIRDAVEEVDELSEEYAGYAYVLPVEPPRVRTALRWAMKGE